MAANSSSPEDEQKIADPQHWQDILISHFSSHHDISLSLDSRSSSSEAQRRMDRDLQALENLVTSFRFQRNRLSSVNQMPPEILARVFMFIQTIPLPPFGPGTDWGTLSKVSADDRHVFSFTHVCRRWRDVALKTPALWANITFATNKKWFQELLPRAQSAPLLVVRRFASRSPDFQDMSDHACQLRHLAWVNAAGSEAFQLMISESKILRAPARFLESLWLSQEEFHGEWYSDGTALDAAYVLPVELFGGHCPVLRHVALLGLMLPWTSTLWGSHITHMEISLFYLPESAVREGFEDFFHCLARMPALELLKLKNCLPVIPRDPEASTRQPTALMPNLRILSVTDVSSRCGYAFDHLRCPSLSQLKVGLYRDDVWPVRPDWLTPVLPALTTYVDHLLAGRPIQKVQITDDAAIDVKVWCSGDTDTDTSMTLAAPPIHLSLESARYDLYTRSPPFLGTLCTSLPLHEVEDLELHFQRGHDVAHDDLLWSGWMNILGRCDSVRRLSLSVSGTPNIWPVILKIIAACPSRQDTTISATEASASNRLCLPGLETIIINVLPVLTGVGVGDVEEPRDVIGILVQQLSLRRTLGAPVHTLRIDISHLRREYLSLKALETLSSDGVVAVVELMGGVET